MEKISELLKKCREEKGLTIKECADQVGVSSSTYRDWEYGRAISGEPYVKIAHLFGITLSELFGRNPQKMNKELNRFRRKPSKMFDVCKKYKVISMNRFFIDLFCKNRYRFVCKGIH